MVTFNVISLEAYMPSLPTFAATAEPTMSSREIADLLETRHDSVKRTMERLAEGDLISFTPTVETSHEGSGARPVEVYLVGKRDSYVVVARLSPEFTARLVDRWQELEQAAPRPATAAEMFAHSAQVMLDIERRQNEQARALHHIEDHVERIEQSMSVMSSRPANAEAITHIRDRINKTFGLSAATIDAVMRQSPYAPKPAGMVKNEHAEAEGATYAVYWQKDVTSTFKRFLAECQPASAVFFTHPFIDGRFRIANAA